MITFYADSTGESRIDKSADAVLDYTFNWAAPDRDGLVWLAAGETIISRVVTVGSGITKDSDAISADGKSVVVWLSGGSIGVVARVTCRITTSAGRTDSRSFLVAVVQR